VLFSDRARSDITIARRWGRATSLP